jgi:predicted Rossmann fold nucleotide-binding protein DprA/Smf involved in DNA uptake
MGHAVNAERAYQLLRQQMDHNVSGVPETPAIMSILKLLYSPEEAELARQLPTHPKALSDLARRLAMPEDELQDKLTELARRGLVLDIERKGQRYYALPPVLGASSSLCLCARATICRSRSFPAFSMST